jgi:hypothetical protein
MKNEFMEEVKSSASASYGPISMEGSARDKEESSKAEDKEEAGTISIKDPQIIGFTCTVVPKCPAKPVK